jgi:hypothetical protein
MDHAQALAEVSDLLVSANPTRLRLQRNVVLHNSENKMLHVIATRKTLELYSAP